MPELLFLRFQILTEKMFFRDLDSVVGRMIALFIRLGGAWGRFWWSYIPNLWGGEGSSVRLETYRK